MAQLFSIDTAASREFAIKLQSMKRSAFPNAVRETLNKSALNVKQKTMPVSAKNAFTERSRNFFKANSKVDFAKGYDIKTMKATVGFISEKLKGGSNFAVKDLEQQEEGGKIKGRSFMPLDSARAGKSNKKLVLKKNRIENVLKNEGNIIKVKRSGNAKQAWIKSAFVAKKLHGSEAYVLGRSRDGRQTLSRIDSISSSIKGKKLNITRTALYSYIKGKAVKASGTGFMKRASFESAKNMNDVFVEEAKKQINRIKR